MARFTYQKAIFALVLPIATLVVHAQDVLVGEKMMQQSKARKDFFNER